jgi:hypothetical protein
LTPDNQIGRQIAQAVALDLINTSAMHGAFQGLRDPLLKKLMSALRRQHWYSNMKSCSALQREVSQTSKNDCMVINPEFKVLRLDGPGSSFASARLDDILEVNMLISGWLSTQHQGLPCSSCRVDDGNKALAKDVL